MLLIEVNPDGRRQHGQALADGGYAVTAVDAWPSFADSARLPAIVISDVPSFHLLREAGIPGSGPVVVLADDAREGVFACLRGADAWVPTHGDGAYLLDTIGGLARRFKLVT